MRKILVPTDFSTNAKNALFYACELFKYERSDFYILHSYADEVYNEESLAQRDQLSQLKKRVEEDVSQKLNALVSETTQKFANPRHTFIQVSEFGTLVDDTNDLVEKENIDLVIMGSKGKTDDKKITFGSHALQIIKYVKSPVLAVPEGVHKFPPKNILFPTDYMLPYKRRELKLLCELSKSFRSAIVLFHLSKFEKLSIRQEQNQEFIKSSLKECNLDFQHKKGHDVAEAIREYIAQKDVDLLVMVNTIHSYLEGLLLTSKIDEFSLNLKVPFLVLQNLPRTR